MVGLLAARGRHVHRPAGNSHAVGDGKVSPHLAARGAASGSPTWTHGCPRRELRDVRAHRGRFRSAAMSASGSTVFVINRFGDMFTRLYDFDISGPDSFFVDYSYEDQRGVRQSAIQLPAGRWTEQPKIPGRITERDLDRQARHRQHPPHAAGRGHARGRTRLLGEGHRRRRRPGVAVRATGGPLSGTPTRATRGATPRAAASGRARTRLRRRARTDYACDPGLQRLLLAPHAAGPLGAGRSWPPPAQRRRDPPDAAGAWPRRRAAPGQGHDRGAAMRSA